MLLRVSIISFSQIIKALHQLSLCCVELVELLPASRYSVDIFHYSRAGIFGSVRKQNSA